MERSSDREQISAVPREKSGRPVNAVVARYTMIARHIQVAVRCRRGKRVEIASASRRSCSWSVVKTIDVSAVLGNGFLSARETGLASKGPRPLASPDAISAA